MKKIFALCILFFIGASAFCQTKRIAHRSHSGKNRTLILTTGDNFGLPEHAKRKDTIVVKRTDSVKIKKVYKKRKKVRKLN